MFDDQRRIDDLRVGGGRADEQLAAAYFDRQQLADPGHVQHGLDVRVATLFEVEQQVSAAGQGQDGTLRRGQGVNGFLYAFGLEVVLPKTHGSPPGRLT